VWLIYRIALLFEEDFTHYIYTSAAKAKAAKVSEKNGEGVARKADGGEAIARKADASHRARKKQIRPERS